MASGGNSGQKTAIVILGLAGVAYALIATYRYISHAELIILWFGIELSPITIIATALRLEPLRSIAAIVAYLVLMEAAVFLFTPFNMAEAIGLFTGFGLNIAFQVPVWLLTWLIVRAVTSLRRTPAVGR